MKRLSAWKKIAILAVLMAAACQMTAFADGDVKTRSNGLAEEQKRFPFEVVMTEDCVERKCYTGYGQKYETGYAITPDTEFEVVSVDPSADAAELRIELDMVYFNDSGKGNKVEKVTTYDYGDISASDGSTYSFLTDRSRENLEERGKLYSDSQRSLRMTLSYNGSGKKTEKQYYQVCTEDDILYYVENADAQAAETAPETAAVYYAESAE